MAQATIAPDAEGVVNWDQLPGNYTRRGFRFAFYGRQVELVLDVQNPGDASLPYYRLNGGTPVPFANKANVPLVIMAATDNWNDLEVINPNGDNNALYWDIPNFAKVTSDAGIPRITYTEGLGKVILPTDLEVDDNQKVVQSATMYAKDQAGMKVFGTVDGIIDPNIFTRQNISGFTVNFRTTNNGDTIHFTVLKKKIGVNQQPVEVAEAFVTGDGKVHTLTLTQAENENAEWFLYHNNAAGMDLLGICLAGASSTNPLVPLILTGGLKAAAFGIGTSIMLSSFDTRARVNTSLTYWALLVISLGYISASAARGSSAMRPNTAGGNDGTGFDGLSRVATVLPNVRGTVTAFWNNHAENDSTQTANYAQFEQDLIDVGVAFCTNYPGGRYVVGGMENPTPNALNPTILAAMVGTEAAPGILRRVPVAVNAQLGATRAFFQDNGPCRAALNAGFWTYETAKIHQAKKVIQTMARKMASTVAPALGVAYSEAAVATLDDATITAIAAKVERPGGIAALVQTAVNALPILSQITGAVPSAAQNASAAKAAILSNGYPLATNSSGQVQASSLSGYVAPNNAGITTLLTSVGSILTTIASIPTLTQIVDGVKNLELLQRIGAKLFVNGGSRTKSGSTTTDTGNREDGGTVAFAATGNTVTVTTTPPAQGG